MTNQSTGTDLLGIVRDAAVLVTDGLVEWVGADADVPAGEDREEIDFGGRAALPGFVDAHTHVVFAGDRADEFAQRLRGDSYEEIMAAGGGIVSTVAATRAAGDELFDQSARRVATMGRSGTTTVEIKSGYGLDVATEVRILEVAQQIGRRLPVDVVPTFLGAHAVPAEYEADRDAYLDLVVDEMLPACAPLARFCDVFCDRGAFTIDEARRVIDAGARHGLIPRLHADQLASSGGANLAASSGAASADHLDHVTQGEIAAMAEAGTVAVLLPGVSLSLRIPYPDHRPLLEAGVVVALATDANPGTSYVLTMPFVVALACLEMGMSVEQAVWSATRGGALALRLPDRGRIAPGAIADLVVLDAEAPAALAYRPDSRLVHRVFKRGAEVVSER